MSKKSIILFTVFIDVLGLGIIIPTLPFYVESFGTSAFVVTALFSVYSLFSFFSAPILGAISDKIGRRPVLLISIASTAIGWFIFAAAKNVPMLFLGRIIDGLASGNYSTAQSYMVDISKDEKERTHNLGQMGAIFGISFIIGPAIGGLLGSISPTLPFWFVAILASLNAILAYFKLPETHVSTDLNKKISINPFIPIINSFKDKKLFNGLLVFFLFGLAVSMQHSTLALYLNKVFDYHSFATGLVMVCVGTMIAINQGLLLKKFWLKYWSESTLEKAMLLTLSIGFFLTSSSILGIYIIGIIATTFGQSIVRVIMTSVVVGRNLDKKGEILGLMSSVTSLAMVIGPIIAGLLFLQRANLPLITAGFISLIALFFVIFKKPTTTSPVKINN